MHEEKSPWKTLNSEEVYSNPWISVLHEEVLTPSGKQGIYGVVHFKNLTVAILALDAEMNTWLVGQYRYPLKKFSWELPQGGGPIGIDPVESAQRELLEEVGVKAKTWQLLLDIHTTNSVTDEYGLSYIATNIQIEKPQPDDTELIKIKKLPFEEAVDMAINGEITESVSLATLFKAKLIFEKNGFSEYQI